MADNVTVDNGALTDYTAVADEITSPYTGGTALAQGVKIIDGTADGATVAKVGAKGLEVDQRLTVTRIQVTPTVSTSPAYTAKDAVGGLLTFANAARSSGGSILVQSLTIVDKGQQMPALDLVLFRATITAPTDNAIFAPSDAELANYVGSVRLPGGSSAWEDFSTNSVISVPSVGLEAVLSGTDLFGALVTRGTPTFTSTSDIVVTLTILQD